jgi:hypothetical protein
MVRLMMAAAVALVVAVPVARADRAAADHCAAALPPASQAIYNNSLAAVLHGQSAKDAITATTRSMVMGGTLSRADARPAAQAAGNCMQLLR